MVPTIRCYAFVQAGVRPIAPQKSGKVLFQDDWI